MTAAVACFHFEIPGLWVVGTLLATADVVEREGRTVYLMLSSEVDDFGVGARRSWDENRLSHGTQRHGGVLLTRSVLLLRATLSLELPFGAEDFDPLANAPRPERLEAGRKILQQEADVAGRVVRDYTEIVRVDERQHWLVSIPRTTQVAWLTEVFEQESGKPIPIDYDDSRTSSAIYREVELGRDGVAPKLVKR